MLSIDVGSSRFYAVEGNVTGGSLSLGKAADIQPAAGTVEDGVIRNHASFITTLNKLMALKDFTSKKIAFTFSGSGIISRQLDLPAAKPRDLARMVRNEMMQIVNDTSEYVYEYAVTRGAEAAPPPAESSAAAGTKRHKEETAGTVSIWAYAVPRDVVDGYYQTQKSTRLRLTALDCHTNSIEKLFAGAEINGRPMAEGATLLADIEEDEVEIHLFSGRRRVFSRIAPCSFAELKAVLAQRDAADLSIEQLLGEPGLSELLRQYIQSLEEELSKMVQFQGRRESGNPVKRICLYGSVACTKGLDRAIEPQLGVPVEIVQAVSKVRAADIQITKYINAIGALIRL